MGLVFATTLAFSQLLQHFLSLDRRGGGAEKHLRYRSTLGLFIQNDLGMLNYLRPRLGDCSTRGSSEGSEESCSGA